MHIVATPRGQAPQRTGRSWLATDYPARIKRKGGVVELIKEVLLGIVSGLITELLVYLAKTIAKRLRAAAHEPKHKQ